MPQDVGGRLGHKHAQTGLLSNRFLFVEGKLREHRVLQGLPEFLHEIDEGCAGNQALGQMEQIGHDRRPDLGIVEKFRIVVPEQARAAEIVGIGRIVEGPAERVAPRPFLQPRLHTVVTGGREVLYDERETAQLA